MKKLGIEFCGNCNPEIDSRRLYERLKEILAGKYEVTTDKNERDFVVLISGCASDCAKSDYDPRRTIRVAGCSVDSYPCEEGKLAEEVVGCLRQRQQSWQLDGASKAGS